MRRPTRSAICSVPLWVILLSSARALAAAETCPDAEPDPAARRTMAKEWFTKAEEAEAAGDRQAAVRRYACSLKLVPHPSTAYNLGTIAEKSGDLSMAVDAFKMYLELAPDAGDRSAVQTRMSRLEARIAELRLQLDSTKPSGPGPTTATAPVPDAPRAAPVPPVPRGDPPEENGGEGIYRHRVAGWIVMGGAAAALGTGVGLNLVARSKMRDCRARYAENPVDDSLALCSSAKSFAYGSYGLFATAGVLGLTGITLLFWSSPADTTLSFVPGPGGGIWLATGRF